MDIREWALLIFTILGQLAAGALIVLVIVRAFAARKAGADQVNRLADAPLYFVVPIMVLALLASVFHLGSPLNIARAVPNLGSSWLSREVVIAVVFVIMAAAYTFMQWRKIGSGTARTIVGWIAALIGLFQTYAMSQVYMIRTQPSWNTFATPVTFLTTSLLIGALLVAVIMVATRATDDAEQAQLLQSTLRGIALACIVLVGVEFVVLPVYTVYLSTQGAAALGSLSEMIGSFGSILVLRLIFVFLGAGVLGFYLYESASVASKERTMATVVYAAFILAFIGEAMGRYIFYATRMRIGL